MTQTVFAQFIGMSPASLSSIFNERTKPSINIVEAIRKKIPDINLEWLMFGTGPMYTDSNKAAASPTEPLPGVQDSLFDFSDSTPSVPEPSSPLPENRAPAVVTSNSVKSTHLCTSQEVMSHHVGFFLLIMMVTAAQVSAVPREMQTSQ